ncbi:hypothetical protein K0M31_015870 [Melipona bicolor]|uniref:Uncharacterized protein n=1 Tax=Melipona bicolor TaxID=60889 RepID=A0AA40G5Z5_9HYME|nr:hypothetical protein K0M31_015870 [Melipona bicolor]
MLNMNRHLSGSERKREKTGRRQARLEIERKMENEAVKRRRPREEDERDEEDQENDQERKTRKRDIRHRENIF